MVIPMDLPSSPKIPHGPMTRACARAIENEVNSLLIELPFDPLETWLLPQTEMLCVLRYQGSNQGEVTMQDGHREHEEDLPSPERPVLPPQLPPQLPVDRYNRPTTAQTTGQPSVIERYKAGIAPVIPVTAKRPVLPPRQPVLPPLPSANTSRNQRLGSQRYYHPHGRYYRPACAQ